MGGEGVKTKVFSWCSRPLLRGVLFRQTHEPSRQPFEGLAREGDVWDVGVPSPVRKQTSLSPEEVSGAHGGEVCPTDHPPHPICPF